MEPNYMIAAQNELKPVTLPSTDEYECDFVNSATSCGKVAPLQISSFFRSNNPQVNLHK